LDFPRRSTQASCSSVLAQAAVSLAHNHATTVL
jgi:hypothetical protein